MPDMKFEFSNTGSLRYALVFFVFFITIAVNSQDNIMMRLGFDHQYLLTTLVALVVTGLIAHRRMMLIVLVLFMSIGANMPEAFLINLGIDRDYLTGGLIAIVLGPAIVHMMK
jgi:hypothetical protein